MSNLGASIYELAYVKSPIFLVDGIASFAPGGVLPLISITQAGDIALGVNQGKIQTAMQDFFANFFPLPGSELVNLQIGSYPFANQKTAANAVIFQALSIPMRMNITPRLPGGMSARIGIMSALKFALDKHNSLGGSYNVLTPTYFYTGCILSKMRDITTGESKHQQTDWQLDFIQPLIDTSDALSVQNSLFQKMTAGVKTP